MAGFTFDSKHCYTYFMRTVPNIKNNLMPPEKSISELFMKSFLMVTNTGTCIELFESSGRCDGLGIKNP